MDGREAQQSIKERLLASKRSALAEAELIRSRQCATEPSLCEHLRKYVYARASLAADRCSSDSIDEIVAAGLEQSLRLDGKRLATEMAMGGCDGLPPAVSRKILLYLAVQRDFQVELPRFELAKVKTVADLSRLVWQMMERS